MGKIILIITRTGPLFLFFLNFIFCAGAQSIVITGVVRDAKTNAVLPFAAVFINQTTRGTVTDANGIFSINRLSTGTVELVCTYVGYQSYSSRIEIREGQIYRREIRLTPSVVELDKVDVTGKRDKEWDLQLKKFKRVFLGDGPNANACQIINPWHLEFKEESTASGNRFTASSSQPLEIENMALGYHITFHLKRLENDQDMFVIGGRSQFRELRTADSSLAKTWTANRAKTFLGSLRHLLTSLRDGRVKEEGFLLYFKTYPPPYKIQGGFNSQIGKSVYRFPSKNMVSHDAMSGLYQVSFNVPIVEVHYSRRRAEPPTYPDVGYPVSWLEIKKGSLLMNSQGLLMNPADLFTYGAMNSTRIADLLPDDYVPGAYAGLTPDLPQSMGLADLQEKVYLHTDKAYYYPGERIWFKAYVNYRSPVNKDTLSRVLYVELISKDKKIIRTEIIRINNGLGWGVLALPKGIYPGDYFIRSYTQWMLNYSPREKFYRFLPVLQNDQIPLASLKDSTEKSFSTSVQIETNKRIYRPREKIEVRFLVADENGFPQPANLSVSVTDVSQVVPLRGNSILSQWPFVSASQPAGSPKFAIESGIGFSAICTDRKGKPVAENLLLVKNDSKESILIDTPSNGQIRITGLQFEDTATFVVKSVGTKKVADHIEVSPRFIPLVDSLIAVPLKLRSGNNTFSSPVNADMENSILLKPVVIQATRLDNNHTPGEFANYAVDGKTLEALNPNSLLLALNARFPFIRINTVYEADGHVPVQRVDIKGNYVYNMVNTPEPLLFINGLQVNLGGEPIYNILLRIPPDQVERIEINKLGSGSSYSPTYGNRGSILIFLKSGDPGDYRAQGQTAHVFQKIVMEGYQRPLNFKAPDYSLNPTTEFSDTRSLVYWNPQLSTGGTPEYSTFSFYSADLPTRYRIEIEGVTLSGKPVRAVAFIEIVK